MAVSVSLDPKGQRLFKAMRHFPERVRLFRRWVLRELAEDIHRGVLDRIPGGRDNDRYARSIRVKSLQAGSAVDALSVAVDPKRSRSPKVDPALTVVFVRHRGPNRDPAVEILRRHSPWTLDTIPLLPSKRRAAISMREVSERSHAEVARLRAKDAPAWRMALNRLGYRDFPGAFAGPNRSGEAVPTLLYVGARLEFGGEDAAVPHWRPAVMDARRALPRRALQKSRLVLKLLTDPTFSTRSLLPRLPRQTVREAKDLLAFQERLHLKGASST